MPSALNIFPARVAIGRVMPSGDVLMTPEFSRALADLMVRVGGPSSLSMAEMVALFSSDSTGDAASGTAARAVAELAIQQAAAPQMGARIAVLERRIEDLARLLHSAGPAPVDWEHPGKLGDKSPNSARVTTLNRITFTQPAVSATFTLATGKTLIVSNTLTFTGTDGSTLNIGAGGALGTAAFQNTSAFAARTNTALAAAATDAASTQALANSMRTALLSVGIGT